MILLCCLAGGFFRYSDTSILLLMDSKKRKLCSFLSLLVPGLFSGAAGLLTIKLTGTMTTPAAEIPAMLLFLLCCMSLANLLYVLCSRQEFYLASIPVLVVGSLIFSPVFINLEGFASGIRFLSRLFPNTHYLVFLICSDASAYLYSRIKG